MISFGAMSKGQLAREKAMKTGVDTTRTFDWDKAATLIKERGVTYADAGLAADLEWTSGTILEKGKPYLDSYAYLASIWACPVIIIDGEEIPCYVDAEEAQKRGWDAHTIWPQSALDILNK